MQSSPNGFTWNTDSAAYAEGRDGKPNRYLSSGEHQNFVDWLHGRLARDHWRLFRRAFRLTNA
jgi:hypothetical protein